MRMLEISFLICLPVNAAEKDPKDVIRRALQYAGCPESKLPLAIEASFQTTGLPAELNTASLELNSSH